MKTWFDADRRPWLRTMRPGPAGYRSIDFARGAPGGLLGILFAALIARTIPGGPEMLPFIVAPIGASAVLVFAAPASPLAQPWSVFVGNVSSAAVGIATAKLIDDVMLKAAVAVGCAIAVMMLLRAVHPPGGACALFAAVGGPPIVQQGFLFALWPVGINTAVLLGIAALVNNLSGRPYPHVPEPPPPPQGADAAPSQRVGVQTEDVREAMARLDRGFDIEPGDVVALLRDAEAHALDRRLGRLRCGDLMARDVATARATESVYRIRLLMNQHRIKAVPVVDDDRHVVGIVTVYDLFNLDVANLDQVAKVMSSPVTTVTVDTPVARLVELMSDLGLRHLPVVDADDRLAGIITRSELIAVLHQALVESR